MFFGVVALILVPLNSWLDFTPLWPTCHLGSDTPSDSPAEACKGSDSGAVSKLECSWSAFGLVCTLVICYLVKVFWPFLLGAASDPAVSALWWAVVLTAASMFLAAPEATSAVLFGGPMLARVLSFAGTLRMHLGWERLGAAKPDWAAERFSGLCEELFGQKCTWLESKLTIPVHFEELLGLGAVLTALSYFDERNKERNDRRDYKNKTLV